MPKVSFYLRNEDVDKWKAVDKKTEFVHDALQVQSMYGKNLEKPNLQETERAIKKVQLRAQFNNVPNIPLEGSLTRPEQKYCPNGHPIPEGWTKCTGKGCKYS